MSYLGFWEIKAGTGLLGLMTHTKKQVHIGEELVSAVRDSGWRF